MFIRIPFEAIVTQFSDFLDQGSCSNSSVIGGSGNLIISYTYWPQYGNKGVTKTYAGCTQFIDPFVGGINTGSMYVR